MAGQPLDLTGTGPAAAPFARAVPGYPGRMDDQQRDTEDVAGSGAPDRDAGRPAGGPPPAGWQPRTGAEQPWDAEDLAVAEGRDPTPENVARAQRELDREGPAAIERTVP